MSCVAAYSFKRNAWSLLHQPQNGHHVGPLDGLRALAALWVVVMHTFQSIPYSLTLPNDEARERFDQMGASFFMRGILNGEYGVDIFFILSGFLIMSILRRELAVLVKLHTTKINDGANEHLLPASASSAASGGGAKDSAAAVSTSGKPSISLTRAIAGFFLRRYLRLMPVYSVTLVVGIVMEVLLNGGGQCNPNIWRNVLFIQNFFPSSEMCLIWTWTIAVEWQMYLVSPLIVWVVLRWPGRSRLFLSTLTFISLALYLGLKAYEATGDPVYFGAVPVIFWPFTRMYAYFAGMLVSVAFEQYQQPQGSEWDHNIAPFEPLTIRAIVLRCIAVVAALLTSLFTSSSKDQNYGWYLTQILLTRPIFVFAMAYIMYDALVPRGEPGSDRYQEAVNRVLGSRPLYFLAQISYSVYLFHLFFQGLFTIFNEPLASGAIQFYPQWIFPVGVTLVLLCTIAVSTILYFLVEKPVINFAAKLLR